MRYFLIMNPGSRSGRSQSWFSRLHKGLQERNIEYQYAVTKSLDDAYELSAAANEQGFDVIVAVGGDGTINRVLNGFYQEDGTLKSQAILGVIYTGTSPDFCKSYGIPLNKEAALDALYSVNVRSIEVGRIEFSDHVKYFVCCANIGLGAMLADLANSGIRRRLGDWSGTFVSLLRTLKRYRPIDIMVNGRKLEHLYNLSIGKTYYIASGLKIKNNLNALEKRFYLLPVQNKILYHLWCLYSGKAMPLAYEQEIQIDGNGRVEFDGDSGGYLPCKINSAENLKIIVGRKI